MQVSKEFSQILIDYAEVIVEQAKKLEGKPGAVVFFEEGDDLMVFPLKKTELLNMRSSLEWELGRDGCQMLEKTIKEYTLDKQIVVGWFRDTKLKPNLQAIQYSVAAVELRSPH